MSLVITSNPFIDLIGLDSLHVSVMDASCSSIHGRGNDSWSVGSNK